MKALAKHRGPFRDDAGATSIASDGKKGTVGEYEAPDLAHAFVGASHVTAYSKENGVTFSQRR